MSRGGVINCHRYIFKIILQHTEKSGEKYKLNHLCLNRRMKIGKRWYVDLKY